MLYSPTRMSIRRRSTAKMARRCGEKALAQAALATNWADSSPLHHHNGCSALAPLHAGCHKHEEAARDLFCGRCVSRALDSSLPDIERRSQTIDRTTAVNLCLYVPTNRSIDEEGNASHPFPRRRRRLCRVKNGHLPNGHDEGSAGSSIWRDAPCPHASWQ